MWLIRVAVEMTQATQPLRQDMHPAIAKRPCGTSVGGVEHPLVAPENPRGINRELDRVMDSVEVDMWDGIEHGLCSQGQLATNGLCH